MNAPMEGAQCREQGWRMSWIRERMSQRREDGEKFYINFKGICEQLRIDLACFNGRFIYYFTRRLLKVWGLTTSMLVARRWSSGEMRLDQSSLDDNSSLSWIRRVISGVWHSRTSGIEFSVILTNRQNTLRTALALCPDPLTISNERLTGYAPNNFLY